MAYTNRVSEDMYPLVSYNADSLGISTVISAYVSMRDYHRGWLYLNVGEMQGTATLDLSFLQATSTAGAGTKVFAPVKGITQLTQAAGDGDQLVCVELQTSELDVDGGFDCVAITVTVAAAAVELAWSFFGVVSRFKEVPTTNWEEIVA